SFSRSCRPRALHSFPTRRSSDLTCEFRGRRILSWALILPLAIPTYIAAFVFYQGPEAAIPLLIQVRLRYGMEAFFLAEQVIRYGDRKSTRLNSSHVKISYAVFCL